MVIKRKAVEKWIESRETGLRRVEEKCWPFVCFIAQLSTLLVTVVVICHPEANHPLGDKLVHDCYLSWHISLETDKSEADIQEVFEFVKDVHLSVPAYPSCI